MSYIVIDYIDKVKINVKVKDPFPQQSQGQNQSFIVLCNFLIHNEYSNLHNHVVVFMNPTKTFGFYGKGGFCSEERH